MFEGLREKPNVSPQLVNGSMHNMAILKGTAPYNTLQVP